MALATTHAQDAPPIAPGDDPRDPERIREYLAENPDLGPLVDELIERVHLAFPDDHPPFLELSIDHEDETYPGDLFVKVMTGLDYTVARPRLN